MRVETDRVLVPAGIQAVRFLTVEVSAPERARHAERPPVNVALVLDRSGSMGGRKIELARKAVAHAIRLLDTRDRLAVVAFDDEVEVVLAATSASPEAKALALARLDEIDARGRTDLHGGWRRGAAEVLRQIGDKAFTSRRVLVLTDGLANVGLIDHDALVGVAAELRTQGVATTTFGLGADFDEHLLGRIAAEGGGHFYFIEHPRQIPDVLTSELGETLDVVAPSAELVVSAGEDVAVSVLNDLPVSRDGGDLRVRLGDLVSGQVMRVAVRLGIAPRLAGTAALVQCRLTDRAAALFSAPLQVAWTAADRDANAQQPVNLDVLVAAAQQIAARASALALAANRAGDVAGAAELLSRGADAIRELGDVPAIERLTRELERKRDEYSNPMNPLLAKQAYYLARCSSYSREPDGKARRSRRNPIVSAQ